MHAYTCVGGVHHTTGGAAERLVCISVLYIGATVLRHEFMHTELSEQLLGSGWLWHRLQSLLSMLPLYAGLGRFAIWAGTTGSAAAAGGPWAVRVERLAV